MHKTKNAEDSTKPRMPLGALLFMAVGFGSCVSANQLWRSALAGPVTDSAWAAVLSCIAAVLCCLLYRFGKTRWLDSTANLVVLTVASVASLGFYYLSGGDVDKSLLSFLAGRLFDPCFLVLLVLWGVELMRLQMVDMAVAAAAGFAVVALIQFSQAFFIPEVALVASIGVPIASSLMLGYCRYARYRWFGGEYGDANAKSDGRLDPLGWGEGERDHCESAGIDSPPYGKPIPSVLVFVTMAVYALMFTSLQSAWTPVVGAPEHTLVTLSLTALGSLVAAVLLVVFGKHTLCGTMDIIIVLLSLIALYFSTLPLGAVPLYLTFANAAQKVIIYVSLLYGKNVSRPEDGPVALCLAFAGYRLGLVFYPVLSSCLVTVVPNDILRFGCLALCLGYIVVFVLYELRRSLTSLEKTAFQVGEGDGELVDVALLERYKQVAFTHYLQRKFNLTSRELDIVPLASEGKNAATIARELVVSNATAKSHLRNIYLKMDVHSQQELSALLDEELRVFENDVEPDNRG